jgi:pyruvate dehydrogenase E2 component (dihydrolipoamide acetyltransferase)
MIEEFKLPDVGEGVAEGELVEWHVEPGDTVTEDQVVAEVETDKALVEVPSPYNGTVKELLAEAGEIVPVGDVIITFEVPDADDGEADEQDVTAEVEADEETTEAQADDTAPETSPDEDADHTPDARVFAPPSVRRLARELGVALADVDGSGPGGRITEGDVRAAADTSAGETADADDASAADERSGPASASFSGRSATSPGDAGDGQTTEASEAAPAGRSKTLAAPATRQLAKEEGVDIDDVPTDETREGEAFVTPEHVNAYAEAQRAAQEADAAAVSEAGEAAAEPEAADSGPDTTTATPTSEPAETEGVAAATASDADERVPYRGVRRAIGEQMQRSKYTAPHVSHHDTAVVDDLVALRAELKPHAEERGVSLTYMPFVMAAVVKALKEFPQLNAMLDEEAEEIVYRKEYHLGVAVATEAGLMVPVVRDVDRKGAVDLASELGGLVERARERKISREEMQGSTFTLTNFGAIGGEYATPIINYPEVAILGLGAIEQRPVVEDGEVVARHTLPLSLSIDHRVVDGADAGRFTNRVIELLENPRLLLL